MNRKAIDLLAQNLRTMESAVARRQAVQAILPTIYKCATFKFNAVQFCIDANVPALI